MHFGEFLASLRASRRLTQERLASKADVSLSTIVRAERMEECELSRISATAIYSALDHARPLTTKESGAFIEAAKLSNVVAIGEDVAQRAMREAAGLPSVHPARAEAHQIVDELCDILGDSTALAAVKTLAHLRELYASRSPNSMPRDIDVVHPPEQREGYTEQRITTYRVEPPPSKGDAKKKRG